MTKYIQIILKPREHFLSAFWDPLVFGQPIFIHDVWRDVLVTYRVNHRGTWHCNLCVDSRENWSFWYRLYLFIERLIIRFTPYYRSRSVSWQVKQSIRRLRCELCYFPFSSFTLGQRRNPVRQPAVATNFCTAGPNTRICGRSHGTFLMSPFWRLEYWGGC